MAGLFYVDPALHLHPTTETLSRATPPKSTPLGDDSYRGQNSIPNTWWEQSRGCALMLRSIRFSTARWQNGDLVGLGGGDSRLLFEGNMIHLLRAASIDRRDKVPGEQDQKRHPRTRHGLSPAEGEGVVDEGR